MQIKNSLSSTQLRDALALSIIPNVGDFSAKNLISYCGGLEAVFKEKKKALSLIPGIGNVRAKQIVEFKEWDRVEKEIEFTLKHDIKILFYLNEAYPKRLRAHSDSPIVLFQHGDADLNANKMLSIVGTRNATRYGKVFLQELVQDLKPHQASIVSGLAHGIDTCAHKESLNNQLPTIAVLGHGLKTIYPSINRGLAEKIIAQNGALITNYFSDVPGSVENFPARNRIVAGLCDALIVVESAHKGGSMITAEIAHGYDKLCFAVPGNTNNKYSQGCNLLIKLNKAHLLENVGDLVYHLNWNDENLRKKDTQVELFADLNKEEKKVIQLLDFGELGIDDLLYRSKIPMTKLSFILLDLELKNCIKALPGKVYTLN